MANLSHLILPVKDTITGEVTSQTFDLAGSGGDNTNFIGTKEAYDALPASEKEQYDSMDFTNYQDGASYDPVPVKASHNIVESGGVYNAIANSNNVVAPVELTLTSTRAYAVGDQFVYDGLLYKATAAIGVGGAITIGTNCQVAPCVTEQIKDIQIDNGVTSNPTSVAANATAYWDITFSKPFSVIPSVCVSVVTGSPLLRNASIYGVSTTGFIVYFTNNTTAVNPETIRIHWIAVAS